MKALILAAGFGGRMSPLTRHTHKTLIKVNGERIMDRIIKSLVKNNIINIIIVTGYKEKELRYHLNETFKNVNFIFINNPEYRKTNNIYSLALAFEKLEFDQDILLIESDLIYNEKVIETAVNSKYKNVALVSPYKTGLDGTVVQVSKNKITGLFPPHLHDEKFNFFDKYKTLNIYKFSKDFCQNEFKKILLYYSKTIDNNCYYELILGILIFMQREIINCEIISNEHWVEVDDPNDIESAEFQFNKDSRLSILDKSFGGFWNYEVLDFCFIRNMYFPTKSMLAEMKNNLPFLVHNYGSNQEKLNVKLSYVLQYNPQRIIALNGAAQIYPFLSKLISNQTVLIPSPGFGEYDRIFKNVHTYNDKVGFDLNEIDEKIKKVKNVVFVNPNNPTGSILPTKWIIKKIEQNPEKFFIIDESFIEFSDQSSIIDYLESTYLSNLLVIRSMSKSYGLPGIRLGFVYSPDKEMVSSILDEIPIWNLNSLAEFYMEIILKNKIDLYNSFTLTKTDRFNFEKKLKKIGFIKKVYNSSGNYILFQTKDDLRIKSLADYLLKNYDIYIKDVSLKFNESFNKFFRVAVRDPKDNNNLVKVLEELYRQEKSNL